MEHDAVDVYHFMSAAHFLDAVALGQVTPGPVVQTVAAVGYAAHGIGGALLAAACRVRAVFRVRDRGWAPLRQDPNEHDRPGVPGGCRARSDRGDRRLGDTARGFAGPRLAGRLMAAAAVWLIGLRRPVVSAILAAGVIGAIAALAGAPVGA